jgi:hypothetical protein
VAFNTAAAYIEDILLGVMFFRFYLVVAIVTCPAGIPTGVANRTISISTLVIDWETVICYLDVVPVLGIVTI